jgi:hypothetical protein
VQSEKKLEEAKMAIRTAIAFTSLLVAVNFAHAQDTQTNGVTPGKAATEVMDKQVPDMKGECADSAKVDTKAPGTGATEAMGSEVPNMKTADAADCMDANSDSKKN